jgi:antibiotic biosynthesis monooxygenase (ABM) superfamily enzyme
MKLILSHIFLVLTLISALSLLFFVISFIECLVNDWLERRAFQNSLRGLPMDFWDWWQR